MTPDIKRSVAAAYQIKIQAHQISQLIKYIQLLQLKSLGFYLIWKTYFKKSNVCVKVARVVNLRLVFTD